MKLRLTALTIALAIAAAAQRSPAQESHSRGHAVVRTAPPVSTGNTVSIGDEPLTDDAWQPVVSPIPAGYVQAADLPSYAAPAVHTAPAGRARGAVKQASHGIFTSRVKDYGLASGCSEIGCGTCGASSCLSDRVPVYGLWGSAEYMLTWAKGRSVPPLITTDGVNAPVPGSLPGADILFGGGRIGEDLQSAGRITVGVWLDACNTIGVGGRLFAIEGNTGGNEFISDPVGNPLLTIPFVDFQTGNEDAIEVAVPGELAGSASVLGAQDVQTADAFLRTMLVRSPGFQLDLIGGYQFTNIRDGLELRALSTVIDPNAVLPEGTTFEIFDGFSARNEFHGGSIGFMGEMQNGCWRLHTLGKVSIGNVNQTVTISGFTQTVVPPPPAGGTVVTTPGGIFSQQSNSGTFERDETTYIPEAAISLGYQVNPNLELTVGYSLIYWENVVLAGDSIDRVVDLAQAGNGPAGTRPAFTFNETDFWVQGITFGMNLNY